ncbi:MAG: peptidoglycan-binding protein, partial [Clostridia bacterium]|nr:peptidoglycan-binding protein [Clostridia bacterium]
MLLFTVIPQAMADSYMGTVNKDKVFFRTEPRTGSGYHTLLNNGDQVLINGTSGDFYSVSVNGLDGYVMKQYVNAVGGQHSLGFAYRDVSRIKGMEGISTMDDIPVPAPMKRGDNGEDVRRLQQALTLIGFYNTTIDGDYGYNTQLSVKKFQQAVNLADDGTAGEATIRALFDKTPAQSAPVATAKPAVNNTVSSIPVPAPCRVGDSGDDVRYLQQALKQKGFYNSVIDGDFGYNTEVAVKAFQQAHGLTQDGIAGEVTIRLLFGKNAAAPKATEKPVATQKPQNTIDSISDIPVPGTSRKGDSGNDVRYLQQALKLKGYYNTTIDGDYGYNTEVAVKKFQKAMGLSQDGVAGAGTIRALFGKNPTSVTTMTPTQKPEPTQKPANNTIDSISDIPVPGTSRKGDSGNDVRYLQQALKLKGYYNTTIDGDYGYNT